MGIRGIIEKKFVRTMRCSAEVLGRKPKKPVDALIVMGFSVIGNGDLSKPSKEILKKGIDMLNNPDTLTNPQTKLIFYGSVEAAAMIKEAKEKYKVNNDQIIPIAANPTGELSFMGLNEKGLDMDLLGKTIAKYNIKSAYIIDHSLHLNRAYMTFINKFHDVDFYAIEGSSSYDWKSKQFQCKAEIFFIPWNWLALAALKISSK